MHCNGLASGTDEKGGCYAGQKTKLLHPGLKERGWEWEVGKARREWRAWTCWERHSAKGQKTSSMFLLSEPRIQSLDFSYLDHFSGLHWQQATIREDAVYPCRAKTKLNIKSNRFPQISDFSSEWNPEWIQYLPEDHCVTSMELGGQE